MEGLDPHQRPPVGIKAVYKKYQKMKLKELDQDSDIVDLPQDGELPSNSKIRVVRQIQREELRTAFQAFAGDDAPPFEDVDQLSTIRVYEHEDMPGLHIIPSLLPPSTQLTFLSRLLHRDLSNPTHLTNIHTHYTLTYPPSSPSSPKPTQQPPSFFTYPPSKPHPIANPLSPTIHRALPISPLLNKKLRWTTLGGQYDWTLKRYPSTPPPPFPNDTKALLETLFPQTRAEAAIVNLYSPGDTLSLHRDVAEQCGNGLIGVGRCGVYGWFVAICVAWCTADCGGDVSRVFGGLAGG
ncbi:oxidoreductase domain-containing protein [Plenodomus tracheiphilus IPT5]|uniref:Oxidoreductase domain-containing protein n=1 Tax=Plenodomus tracheiphilus IPT5 TaxID=1408161 RepID=A0A6A7AW33_9PLEO|nr:oxidoreductase domain-containing protein [Plenodomus tracheiphilus IPT5]